MACLNTQYEEIKLALLNMVCEYKQFSNQMINRQHEKVKKAETILRNNRIKWLRRNMPEIKNQYIANQTQKGVLISENQNRQNEPLKKQNTCTDQTTQTDDENAQSISSLIYSYISQNISSFIKSLFIPSLIAMIIVIFNLLDIFSQHIYPLFIIFKSFSCSPSFQSLFYPLNLPNQSSIFKLFIIIFIATFILYFCR
ncbi:unnamed protein product [Paramecium octaurelia]|uniref:Transmembrane protein n=1 Tax=Paramecium octaurelia TaxID=43137 RepID=A0A8S1YKQ5_PAROT|nr:unnamed protein product [Paramecium octaurelia]